MFYLTSRQLRVTGNYLTVLLVLIFGAISWNYLHRFYYVGSTESATSLSRRPNVIDWTKYSSSSPLSSSVIEDSYLNFQDEGLRIKEDPDSRPTMYLKSGEGIYPIFMLPKNGGFPLIIIRWLAEWTSPSIARPLFTWLCGMLTIIFSLMLIRRTSRYAVPFMLVAVTSPQIYYFCYSQYPDASLSITLSVLLAWLCQVAKRKSFYVCIGLLAGFCLYIKLSSTILILSVALFYYRRLLPHWKLILAGLIPWIVSLLVAIDWSYFFENAFEIRNVSQPWFEAFLRAFIETVAPDLQFRQSMYLAEPLSGIVARGPIWLIFASFTTIAALIQLFTFGLSRKDGLKLCLIWFFQFIAFTLITPWLNTDLFSYLAQIYLFLVILLFSRLRIRKPMLLIPLLLFGLTRINTALRWNGEFNIYVKDMSNCGWVYECMLKDQTVLRTAEERPIVTLNYLDVGQLEFLSSNRILPLHVNSRWTETPTPDQLISFFHKLPEEFLILSSPGLDGKTLEYYLGSEANARLEDAGLGITLLKDFHYPEQHKAYQWLLVKRK